VLLGRNRIHEGTDSRNSLPRCARLVRHVEECAYSHSAFCRVGVDLFYLGSVPSNPEALVLRILARSPAFAVCVCVRPWLLARCARPGARAALATDLVARWRRHRALPDFSHSGILLQLARSKGSSPLCFVVASTGMSTSADQCAKRVKIDSPMTLIEYALPSGTMGVLSLTPRGLNFR